MTNPLLKAAGIAPDTKGHSAERALFDAAWECVEQLRELRIHVSRGGKVVACCTPREHERHAADCPLVAFDKAAMVF